MKRAIVTAAVMLASPAMLQAQQDHAHSPYADLEVDASTSLPTTEVSQLRSGDGMALALTAELNRYPGPKHALDLSSQLDLSPDQVSALQAVREAMTGAAVAKGEEILRAEAELAALFRSGRADAERVEELSRAIGGLRGELRSIHLAAHVETRALLSDDQVRAYDLHRGYGVDDGAR